MTDNASPLPSFAVGAINLASALLGAKGVSVSDDFFAPLDRMLQDGPAVWDAEAYDDNGKYMDGWESRRKRVPGHDWSVIRLAMPGSIFGFDVDTSYFTGNYPPHCSIEAAFVADGDPTDTTEWTEVLAKSPLGPSAHHFFEMPASDPAPDKVWTHLRLHIYPDGGIARLRVYGAAYFDWSKVGASDEIDLAYIFNGAKSLAWSDAHYGHPDKMLGPGHDWAIIRLGHAGIIRRAIVDTAFYKGNFPDSCEIFGAYLPDQSDSLSDAEIAASENWKPLLSRQKLQMDHIHEYGSDQLTDIGPVTHIRFAMHPDGGVMRLRLFGNKA
jgi:allantoicase